MFIIIAQILTFLWIPLCPKILIQGDVRTSTVMKNGRRSWKARSTYVHPDPVYFPTGLLVIYMSCLSSYLLTKPEKEESQSVDSTRKTPIESGND